jgi:CheY-like chemotaxis protein
MVHFKGGVHLEPGRRMRLLLAEKDPIRRGLISSALASNHEIVSVKDSRGAVGAIAEAHEYGEPFDLVLLNIELSGDSNNEVLRLLRAFEEPRSAIGHPSPKVLFLGSQVGSMVPGGRPFDVMALRDQVEKAAAEVEAQKGQ